VPPVAAERSPPASRMTGGEPPTRTYANEITVLWVDGHFFLETFQIRFLGTVCQRPASASTLNIP
jgi:hypothetical protein